MSEHSDHPGRFDSPESRKRVRQVLYALCTVSVIAEIFVKRYVDHPWEALPGFYAIYGFIACVALVLLATELRKVVMRGEDYYDDH
ncbi:MAG: hypothetical protein OEN23_05260 [Paracoccaceae bacterium]|nr:hypothetical protein [Paracoccaceae bacterium]